MIIECYILKPCFTESLVARRLFVYLSMPIFFPTYFSGVLTVVCPVRLSPYLALNLNTEKHDILFIEILNFPHTCSILTD